MFYLTTQGDYINAGSGIDEGKYSNRWAGVKVTLKDAYNNDIASENFPSMSRTILRMQLPNYKGQYGGSLLPTYTPSIGTKASTNTWNFNSVPVGTNLVNELLENSPNDIC